MEGREASRELELTLSPSPSPLFAFSSLVGDHPNDQNTMVFKLFVKCERNRDAVKGETDPSKLYINENGSFEGAHLFPSSLRSN